MICLRYAAEANSTHARGDTGYSFTPNQQRAIEHREGNLQLIACADSGKTKVLANRVARLLDPDPAEGATRYYPRNIVAFTFTEKAAGELKERVVRRIEERYGHDHGIVGMADFPAKPRVKMCGQCDYLSMCSQGQAKLGR